MQWWCGLCLLAALNLFAWDRAARWLHRHWPVLPAQVRRACRWQLVLSAGYVSGCAYRCVFPVVDIPRRTLVDSWLSSVLVGRSVATLAEVCFALQWALLLWRLAQNGRLARLGALALVPLIIAAEICSWYAVLTTSNAGHVIEESLWALGAAVVLLAGSAILSGDRDAPRSLLAVICIAAGAYLAYLCLVDVPMYWVRWSADRALGRYGLSLGRGVLDALTRRTVSYRWQDWRSEVPWMSLYFGAGVWTSLALIRLPALLARRRARRYGITGSQTALAVVPLRKTF